MAGIIAASSNLQGVIGAAPLVKLAAIKVLSSDGAGHISDCINGLQRVYTKRYPLVNMSLGFPEDNVPLQRAIARLYQRVTIMVASVGTTRGPAARARAAIAKAIATARRISSTPLPTRPSSGWAPRTSRIA